MQIEDIKLTDLKPYANNPRDNAKAVEAVANSIREFGFKVPIVISDIPPRETIKQRELLTAIALR